MEEVKKAPFHITQADGNITEADGVAATWSDIWKYQVPQGSGLILEAGDLISMYLEDTAPAEVGDADCYVRLEVRDASEQDVKRVFGPALYVKVKEFQNRNTIARLQVSAPVKLYPRQWLVLVAKDAVVIDASDSYFDLFTSKIGVPLK